MTLDLFYRKRPAQFGAVALFVGVSSLSIAACADPVAAPQPTTYHVLSKFSIGGDGGWDYLAVNGRAKRLYITRSTHVMVLNEDDGTSVGDLPNTPGVHGTALAYMHSKAFASDGREGTVAVYDTDTFKELDRVKVGDRPDAIIYDRSTDRVFAMNGGSNSVSAIDASTDKVVGTVPLDGRPEYAVSDGQGHIYVNIEDKSEISQIDANKLTVLNTWSIAPGEGPSGLAMDRKNRRLFAVCDNQKMVVLDADKGTVIATPTIGNGPDAAAFDPELGYAFSSNGRDGTLTVVKEVDPNTFTVVQTATTQMGARTMALDTQSHKIYMATAQFGPPAAGGDRPSTVAGSFTILVVGE